MALLMLPRGVVGTLKYVEGRAGGSEQVERMCAVNGFGERAGPTSLCVIMWVDLLRLWTIFSTAIAEWKAGDDLSDDRSALNARWAVVLRFLQPWTVDWARL